MTSVLETKYIQPNRPYCQSELAHARVILRNKLRLGKMRATHQNCGHFYLVKRNSRKEKEMIANNTDDTGNCSVCWKISKTPNHLYENALDLVDDYRASFLSEPTELEHSINDVESAFYRWIYE